MGLETVKLKDGSEEAEVAVRTIMVALEYLVKRNQVAFYELVEVCKDQAHYMWPGSTNVLKNLGLMDSDGRVQDTTRHVVLSAVTGEGLSLGVTSPLAK